MMIRTRPESEPVKLVQFLFVSSIGSALRLEWREREDEDEEREREDEDEERVLTIVRNVGKQKNKNEIRRMKKLSGS